MSWYKNEIKIPIRMIMPVKVIKNEKPEKKEGYFAFVFKKINPLILIGLLALSQVPLLSAFEAHVINVTVRICNFTETRTMGYWKNHPNVYGLCLPLTLGCQPINDEENVNEVFDNANADYMPDMLKGQLLAMKFNICCSGIDTSEGEEFDDGQTLDVIVARADEILCDPDSYTREEQEEVKDLLDKINNLHQIRYCSENQNQELESSGLNTGIPIIDNFLGASSWIGSLTEPEPTEPEPVLAEEEPLVEEPVTEEEPLGEEPVVEEPVEEPAEEGVVEEPVEESVVEEPVVEEPIVEEEPAVEEPAVEEPIVEEPIVEEPVVEEPVVEPEPEPEPVVQEDNSNDE